ncbi:MAG: hypothetical protein DIU79_00010 [Actinobacteria bacterium]|nr:MAG: hypothetical protein DIU79_00010 [Actinomycetota bacterium]
MGTRGPIPKRSEERRRRNKPSGGDITKAARGTRLARPPAADRSWHRLARYWYESLAKSGQSEFYEPSDWATARIWAEILSRQLQSGRISAQMVAAWSAAATELLTTEGARRRMRLELQDATEDDDVSAGVVTALDEYRRALGG